MSIKITEEGKTLLEDAILQDKKVVFSQIELIADVEKSPTEMVKRVDVSKVSASDYNTITVQAQIDNDGFLDTYYFNRANVYADEVLLAYDDGINICIPAETTKVINDLEMMMKIDSAVADLKIIYEGYVLRKDFNDMESKIQKINTTIKDMEANAVTQNDCTDQVSWNSQIVKKEFLTIGNMAFFRATGGFSTSRGSIVLATIPQGYFPEITGNQSSYELMGVFTSAYDKERRNCYVTLNCLSGNVDLQINNNEAYSDTRSDDNVQMIFYGFWKMNAESQGGTGGSISYREDIEKLRQSIQDSKKEIVRSSREIDSLKEDLVYLSSKTASNETKAYDATDLFTLNGFLNKKGKFVSNTGSLCTDYIDAKKGEVYYFYISQDDKISLPVAIYNTDKSFVKGVENKGNSYQLRYFEYTVEEDCLIRISSMNVDSSLIYKKEFKHNSEVFNDINTKIGQLETYYDDRTQYVLEHKTDDVYLNNSGAESRYLNGLVSDYIEVDEGDSIKASSYVLYGNPVLIMYYSNKKVYKAFKTSDDGINIITTKIPPMVKYIRISSLNQSKGISFRILQRKTVAEAIKEVSVKKSCIIPDTYEELKLNNSTNGYIDKKGNIVANNKYLTSDYIDLDNYDYFRLVSDYAYGACGYLIFDDAKRILSYIEDSKNTVKRIDILPMDGFPTAKYIRFCGGTNNLHVYVKKQTTLITNGLEEALETGNVLYHKKIAFCGDSFTEAANLGKSLYDNFIGCYKSFGWRIANRNKMKLYHDGISGSTMHIVNKENPNDRYPFAYERYKNVPVDCDYIILQFGLNESSIADSDTTKGTKDSTDTTTMWGAWNTVLGYLIENHPTARIGIIMSDAWMPQSYYTTLKEICEWWGIPLLDLGGDPNVPVMNGGRRVGSGLILNPKIAELRNATFYNADGDAHPNDKGHEWRSTVIENWIRSL